MRNSSTRFILIAIVAFLFAEASLSAKQILFISSYSEHFETVDLQKKGIHDVLDAADVSLDIMYMDMKQYNTEQNERLFHDVLAYKIAHHAPYDAVLLGDDAALHLAEKYQDELFAGIPLVFFCVNDINAAKEAGRNKYITGSVEEFYLKDTIDIALKINPQATRVIGIVDDTLTGKGDQKQLLSFAPVYPSLEFSLLDTSLYTPSEFITRLGEIQNDSIVIYMDFFEDAEGTQYSVPESVRFITSHCEVPVYRASFGGVGQGLLGGKMMSYEESGRTAASMALEILSGKPIKDIPVVTTGESEYCFDYEALKKFNISNSVIPKNAILVNKKVTFFERYRGLIVTLLSFILLIIIALAVAVRVGVSQHRNSERMKYLAEHDPLTNLPNRRAVMARLESLIAAKKEVTVMLTDIDDFKEINDSDGHLCGDTILTELSHRLIELMKTEPFFASRFGGDEFVLVIEDVNPININRILAHTRELLLQPIAYGEKNYYIHLSMGIADNKNADEKASELISNADLAMYFIKNSGKNSCTYFNYAMKQQLVQKTEITKILDTACSNDGFTVVYQPQIDVATGRTFCYEALVRLTGSNVSPAQFIPVAEESDLIENIGRIVTDKVIEQMALWRKNGMTLHPVSINFSSRQLRDKEYVSYLKRQLEQHDIPTNLIEIEITESIMMTHNDRAMKLLNDFSSMGVSLALDDFGTGYSSISYLTYIPVSKIKLDKSLVDTYLRDDKDALVENIIRLSHSLGLKIAVEGVETERQVERLKDFDCDYIQGYYYSRPIPGAEIEARKFY